VLNIRAKVLDHHVGLLDHSLESRDPLWRFQIERHAALVALKILKVGAFARTTRTLAVDEMGRRLDLDDVCAPIAELTDAGRARANAGQVEHGKARKGLGGPGGRHSMAPEYIFWFRIGFSARHSSICVGLSIGRTEPSATTLFIISRNKVCQA